MRLVIVLALVASTGLAAPPKKTKPRSQPATKKSAPTPSPSPAPSPAPTPSATPLVSEPPVEPVAAPLPAPPPSPPTPMAEKQQPVEAVASPPPPAAPTVGLHLQFSGGMNVPLTARLNPGWLAELGVQLDFANVPLSPFLRVGFERHTGSAAVTFAPPAGGLEPAALESQLLVPVTLGLEWRAFSDSSNAVGVSAVGRVMAVGSSVAALGSTVDERGVGGELGLEAAYARRLASIWAFVRVRYGVRHTAVGRFTSSFELPWYQALGVELGMRL